MPGMGPANLKSIDRLKLNPTQNDSTSVKSDSESLALRVGPCGGAWITDTASASAADAGQRAADPGAAGGIQQQLSGYKPEFDSYSFFWYIICHYHASRQGRL